MSFYINFFQPSVKLIEKRREVAKGKRFLEHSDIPEETKEVLRRKYEDASCGTQKEDLKALEEASLEEALQPGYTGKGGYP